MATVRMILMKDHPANNGRYPIYLRVSDHGKRAHFATGFEATEKEFVEGKNDGRYIQGKGIAKFYVERKENGRTESYDNKAANIELAEMERRVTEILDGYDAEGRIWTMVQLRDDFLNRPKRSLFVDFSKEVIETEYKAKNGFQRAAIVEDALLSFEKYDSQISKKVFQDITPKYIQGYISHWSREGVSNATIAMRLREIRRIFNIAIRDGIVSKDYYPFSSGKEDGKVKIPKVEIKKADQYLTKESLQKIATAKLKKRILDKTRHLFMFSFYCRGINWKDMAQLTKDSFYEAVVTDETTKESRQVKMMTYRRSKTKGGFDIQVTPDIQKELDWFQENTKPYGNFILPIILEKVEPQNIDEYLKQSRRRFNKYLKKLAKELELPESQQDISIYTARHSFAMAMQNQNKSVEIISQALGHQSVETTKHYLDKFSTTKMAEETSGLLDEKEDKTKTSKKGKTDKVAEKIIELSRLVKDGLLTKEEFLKLKTEIADDIN